MKTVSESHVESVELVQPGDLNVNNTLFGGRLVSYVDEVAAICAYRHSQMNVTTVSIDNLHFSRPVPLKAILTLKASVNRVFSTSMEIGVSVSMRLPSHSEDIQVCTAYLTFVGLDKEGNKMEIPQVKAITEEELRRYEDAGHRREMRMALRKKLGK